MLSARPHCGWSVCHHGSPCHAVLYNSPAEKLPIITAHNTVCLVGRSFGNSLCTSGGRRRISDIPLQSVYTSIKGWWHGRINIDPCWSEFVYQLPLNYHNFIKWQGNSQPPIDYYYYNGIDAQQRQCYTTPNTQWMGETGGIEKIITWWTCFNLIVSRFTRVNDVVDFNNISYFNRGCGFILILII